MRLAWCIAIIGLVAGLYGAWKRYQAEQLNRRVELALDYTEVTSLAATNGVSTNDVLIMLRAAGATSVALTEDSLSTLYSRGLVRLVADMSGTVTITATSDTLYQQVVHSLDDRGISRSPANATAHSTSIRGQSVTQQAAFRGDFSTLRSIGVGLDTGEVSAVRAAGLTVVARIGNFASPSEASMQRTLKNLAAGSGAATVIFSGTDVLGFRGMYAEAAGALLGAGLNYGQVEFGKQRGDEQLANALHGQFVRVHSIGEAEMAGMEEPEARERYIRAARERNIRLCYIRLPYGAGPEALDKDVRYLAAIKRGIDHGGQMEFGPAHTFTDPDTPTWAIVLAGAGAGAGAFLALVCLIPVCAATSPAALVFYAALCGGLSMAGDSGRKLAALIAALSWPTIALLYFGWLKEPRSTDIVDHGSVSLSTALTRGLVGLASTSAITAIGIAQMVGLLSQLTFMVKVEQFMGIKLAHSLPVALVGLALLVGMRPPDATLHSERNRVGLRLKAIMDEPLRAGQILIWLLVAAALLMVILRTGNDPGVGVSGIELKLRDVLDRFLPVRPRTKEFLIGHPALFLAFALTALKRRKWAVPLYFVGAIGQVSILNTFCHIHTPLHLSLMRDALGLVIGAVIGALLLLLMSRIPAVREPESAASNPAL